MSSPDTSVPDPAVELARIVEELRGARTVLLDRPATEIATLLGSVGERFLDPGDPLRIEALERIPGEAGLSKAMAARVVDGMARDWTIDRLRTLLVSEFGDPRLLDRFVAAPVTEGAQRRGKAPNRAPRTAATGGDRHLRAIGDGVALHIGAGSVPGVCATSVIRSLLVKTPVLVKPGAGDRALTELFVAGLTEAATPLAAAVAVRYWEGGESPVEEALLSSVDRVVVYGSDRTARSVRDRTPPHTPVVLYHHRISIALIGEEAIGVAPPGAAAADGILESTAADLAYAASTFDQRGCVSPHRAWVLGAPEGALRLAEATARAMAREEAAVPAGLRSEGEQARVQQLRGHAEMEEAAGRGVRLWKGDGTAWTVVYDPTGVIEVGAPRTLVIAAAEGIEAVVATLRREGPHLQSVGMAGLGAEEARAVEALTRIGATRFAALADLPFPPAWWHHDGEGPLRALVSWAEWTL